MKVRQAALMVTRRCNMSCAHCSVESHPRLKKQPGEEELIRRVDDLIAAGVSYIQFTGGEPMLRGELVLQLMARARAAGVMSSLTSNGFWGKKPAHALRTLTELRQAGLVRLAISFDRFHAEFQGPEPVLNILAAAEQLDFPIHINITRTADDAELELLLLPLRDQPYASLRFYDVQPVGLAKNLNESLRAQLDGYCSACEQATVTDDGRVIACNGPAYFEPTGSGLVVGKVGISGMAELLDRHAQDPIIDLIRTRGPSALRKELETLPGFETFPFRPSYSGMCQLCLDINGDPKAVEALRAHLRSPAKVAELVAYKRVLDAARQDRMNREAVNQRGAPAALIRLLLDCAQADDDKVLGRADLDWDLQARMLEQAGLLPHVCADIDNPALRRWAPSSFLQRAREAGPAPEENIWRAGAGSPPPSREEAALAVLTHWKDLRFREPIGSVWRLAWLAQRTGGVDWSAVSRAAEARGQGRAVRAALGVLRHDWGLSTPDQRRAGFWDDALARVVRFQANAEFGASEHLGVVALLPLLASDHPSRWPGAAAAGLWALARKLRTEIAGRGWAAVLAQLRADAETARREASKLVSAWWKGSLIAPQSSRSENTVGRMPR